MPTLLFDHADAPFEAPPEAGDTPPPPPVSWPGPERRAPEPGPRRRRWLTPALAAAVVAGLLGGALGAGTVLVLDDDPTPVASGAAAVTETAATTGASGTGDLGDIQAVLASVQPAVVAIHAEVSLSGRSGFGRSQTATAAGTGMIVTADGLVVTNAHVVEGADTVEVSLTDGRTYTATVVESDTSRDVAVLQLDGAADLPVVTLASTTPAVGSEVITIGNALDLGGGLTVTTGIVSAVGREVTTTVVDAHRPRPDRCRHQLGELRWAAGLDRRHGDRDEHRRSRATLRTSGSRCRRPRSSRCWTACRRARPS